ncbi:MAG TPA: 4-hydroxythreonine-4-phosphate dehydrogenase PdxA [Pirellulaceae bacterium]|nr:4-hydroxythreonine-4-phosphate dehydrogenase PdxA [Pirellulaceae bacterium]
MQKPLLAITMGDPAGIGPETIAGAWRQTAFHDLCRAVVIGRPQIMQRAANLFGDSIRIVEVSDIAQVESNPTTLPCLACGSSEADDTPPAQIDARGGQAAYDALRLATDLALTRIVDAIVTAPLHKAALHAAGHYYPGHTELLAELCGVPEVAMMLYLAHGERVQGRVGLGVAHVTLHTALRKVWDELTEDHILAKAHLADAVTKAFLHAQGFPASERPRIGVCALNPHAGEQGLFGDEEIQIIGPAVERGRAQGLNLTGPLPTDTLMTRAASGEFDAIVAMYHDQGHIALKLLDMYRAVNITLGLPIIRTSVAHGTAFDLAWQGKGHTRGMVEAVRVAAQLVSQRAQLVWQPAS